MRDRSFHRALWLRPTLARAVLSGASLLILAGVALAAEANSPLKIASEESAKESIAKDALPKAAPRPVAGQKFARTEDPAKADLPAKALEALAVDRADWVPDHAVQRETSPAASSTATSGRKASRGEDAAGPDDEVTTPAAVPSHDPLDRLNGAKTDGKIDGKTDDKATPDAGKKAEEPLPALNAAIKAALDKRGAIKGAGGLEKKKQREAIAFFYAAHGFAPAWSQAGKATAAVDPVIARLARAGEDALDMPSPPKALKTEGTSEEIADSDIALTEAVVSYARQATGSRIDPHAISPLIGARPDLADPAEVLDRLVGAGSGAGDTLEALNPSEPRYAALRKKLAEMRAGHSPALTTVIPPGPTLRIGLRDDRVPMLRAHFGLDAPADLDADELYDKSVAAAVADFQRANDLPASGRLTKETVAALAGEKPSRSEATIVANMEMWRWMPRDLGTDRIEVNVPDYMVTVFHEGEQVGQNRVVVGKTDTPTPLFSNTMKFLIVNPVWNVPQSIIQNEMGGEERSGFTARYVHGRLFLQQPPGPKNALGRIKFMFPNPFSVYLHDTPAKHLFATTRRAYSHGCVRVDKPFDFAEIVLNQTVPEGGKILWSQERLQKMLGNTERYVDLPKPLPIHIEYFTASVDESGKLKTREDIYGYTRSVAAALGQDVSTMPAPPRIVEKPARVAERRAKRQRRLDAEDADGMNGAPPSPMAPPRQAATGWFGGGFW